MVMNDDQNEPARPGAVGSEPEHITTTTRDPAEVEAVLGRWLQGQLGEEASPEIIECTSPQGNGMSSETLLFTARWRDVATGEVGQHDLVARIEPPAGAYPVFTTYDLAMQYRVMQLVGEATRVPVPTMLFFEADPTFLGGPFFVMSRVDGRVPPDVLPYTFGDNWVFDASDEERTALEASALRALAGVHSISPADFDLSFVDPDVGTDRDALSAHLDHWEEYHHWVVEDRPSPLLTEAFSWLRQHQPASTGDDVLSWGDSRIGNMMFQGFDVVAVLDWEMASVAPREVDLGWMCYLHLFFQDLAVDLGAPGLPAMFTPSGVRRVYEDVSGVQVGDLKWYIAYAAIRHGVIMRRVTERSIFFGENEAPEDIDDLIMHRATIEGMLDGTYWDRPVFA